MRGEWRESEGRVEGEVGESGGIVRGEWRDSGGREEREGKRK